jgi:hypothetical protein
MHVGCVVLCIRFLKCLRSSKSDFRAKSYSCSSDEHFVTRCYNQTQGESGYKWQVTSRTSLKVTRLWESQVQSWEKDESGQNVVSHRNERERTEHQASAVTIDRTRLVIVFRLWTSLNVTGPCKGRVRFFYRWVRSQLNEHMFVRWLLGSRSRGWMQVTRGYILVTGPWYRQVWSVWKVSIKGVQWLYLFGGYKTKY